MDVGRAVRAAATAELAWVEDAAPRARAVVPYWDGDHPVLAVTYADAGWARSLATRGRVVLTLSDRRLCGGAWAPLALTAVPRLVEDLTGEMFTDSLLDAELRKHPPARALADSVMLRREHWWFLPRLMVHLDVVDAQPFPARNAPDDALLVTVDDDGVTPRVRAVALDGRSRPRLRALDDAPVPDAGEALLLGHDFTEPDLERWVTWEATGALRAGALEGDVAGERRARRMPRLGERMRRHRELRRACTSAIAEAERAVR